MGKNKELKKLSRRELLELLIEQGREIDTLKAELEEAEKKLSDKTIKIREAGTVAEAAFMLNGVYEAAEAAVSQYVENIKKLSEQKEMEHNREVYYAERRAARFPSEGEEKQEVNDTPSPAEEEKKSPEYTAPTVVSIAEAEADVRKAEEIPSVQPAVISEDEKMTETDGEEVKESVSEFSMKTEEKEEMPEEGEFEKTENNSISESTQDSNRVRPDIKPLPQPQPDEPETEPEKTEEVKKKPTREEMDALRNEIQSILSDFPEI